MMGKKNCQKKQVGYKYLGSKFKSYESENS